MLPHEPAAAGAAIDPQQQLEGEDRPSSAPADSPRRRIARLGAIVELDDSDEGIATVQKQDGGGRDAGGGTRDTGDDRDDDSENGDDGDEVVLLDASQGSTAPDWLQRAVGDLVIDLDSDEDEDEDEGNSQGS